MVPACGQLSPAVSLGLPLGVRRQRVLLVWTVARRPAVVTITALSSGAALRRSVTVLILSPSPPVPSPPPHLPLQHACEEAVIVTFAQGLSRRTVTVPRVPPLLRRREAAAVPAVLFVPVEAPGRAVVPLVDPVRRLRSTTTRAVRQGELLQLVQGAGAPSPAQRLPLQVF